MTVQKVVAIGNSLGVFIPKAYQDRMGLKQGDHITIELTHKGLLVRPLKLQEGVNDEEKKK